MKLEVPGLMILGTDTEVGKTFAACCILRELNEKSIRVCAYKPVASGIVSVEQSDPFQLWQASGCRGLITSVCPQRFVAPLAPPLAAEAEHTQVNDALLVQGAEAISADCDFLVVEGAGGLMSPISWTMTNAGLALELGLPVVLVAINRLGVVNQVLTSLVTARALGLRVRCLVLNQKGPRQVDDISVETNERLLRKFLNPQFSDLIVTNLKFNSSKFEPSIEWQSIGSIGSS